jgi:3-dehydroquinate dehydratase II
MREICTSGSEGGVSDKSDIPYPYRSCGRLGKREPHIYGTTTLSELEEALTKQGMSLGCDVLFFQSNHEGDLIDRIEQAIEEQVDGIILNAGGLTHTSIALMDAIKGSGIATVEVHLSQIYQREEMRHTTLTGRACVGVITGLGMSGYHYALAFLAQRG